MTKALNHTALKAKLVSIFSAHKEMKAVSKMLTQNFSLSKTDTDGVLVMTLASGEKQDVRVVDNRFVVIGYSKPKGAKNAVIYLNKSTPIESLSARKVVVIDLEQRSIQNGDAYDGFQLVSDNNVPVNFMLASSLHMVTVRNYITHTQLYVATMNDKMSVVDNIKEVRAFINAEIDSIKESFSKENVQKFEEDIELALS